MARQIDVTSRVERRWKQWIDAFSCISYNYNPAGNFSMDIAVFSTPIFLIYSPRVVCLVLIVQNTLKVRMSRFAYEIAV